jgi:quercetin dioxygenase-like cupin family protein
MRPNRHEVISPLGTGTTIEIAPGVRFECLVGAHNQAHNLTTGIVSFDAGAELPYHTHPFSESVTLLAGGATIEVEGRSYELEPLDNMVIPPGIPHFAKACGASGAKTSAILHVAMASPSPTRVLVDRSFPRRAMRPSTPSDGPERVNWFRTAPRYEAGPNTAFIDFFNKDLLPGIEMSGGYGLFYPRGRLPAHVHDFDESICIIDGTATCIVEGRRYSMSGCATALQPRGRVHYFINDSTGPMAMLWVYAGPVPERIVVDERCATAEGNPWR